MRVREMTWLNAMSKIPKRVRHICVATTLSTCFVSAATSEPNPLGKLVDLGGHWLHMNCTGKGGPLWLWRTHWEISRSTGFFSLFTRICTYDREFLRVWPTPNNGVHSASAA